MSVAVALVLPSVPIAYSWFRVGKSNFLADHTNGNRMILGCLVIQTLSTTHLLLGVLRSSLLGPDYSTLRYSVIFGWVFLSALTFFAAFSKSLIRPSMLIAGALLTFCWLYVGAVSSVV